MEKENAILESRTSISAEGFQKAFVAMKGLAEPLQAMTFGNKRMRVVIDYDPQNPCVKLNYYHVED